MNFNTIIQTKGRDYDLETVANIINGLAKNAADYVVGIDPEIDFLDAKDSISEEVLDHLRKRIGSLPKNGSIISFGWIDEPVEFRIDITVDDAKPAYYKLTITDSHGKTDTWVQQIAEFSGGDREYIELRKMLKRYGFRNPSTPDSKYRVVLMGKEAVLTAPELCRLERDLAASGSTARPLFAPIKETAGN